MISSGVISRPTKKVNWARNRMVRRIVRRHARMPYPLETLYQRGLMSIDEIREVMSS